MINSPIPLSAAKDSHLSGNSETGGIKKEEPRTKGFFSLLFQSINGNDNNGKHPEAENTGNETFESGDGEDAVETPEHNEEKWVSSDNENKVHRSPARNAKVPASEENELRVKEGDHNELSDLRADKDQLLSDDKSYVEPPSGTNLNVPEISREQLTEMDVNSGRDQFSASMVSWNDQDLASLEEDAAKTHHTDGNVSSGENGIFQIGEAGPEKLQTVEVSPSQSADEKPGSDMAAKKPASGGDKETVKPEAAVKDLSHGRVERTFQESGASHQAGRLESVNESAGRKGVVPAEAKPQLTQDDPHKVSESMEKAHNDLVSAQSEGAIKAGAEARGNKLSQTREHRYNRYRSVLLSRADQAASRETPVNSTAFSDTKTDYQLFNAISGAGFSGAHDKTVQTEESEILWKEHTVEFEQLKEKENTDSQIAGFARLGQLPVSNISVRRNFVTGFSQSLLRATGDGKDVSENWQKHNFVLDGGKNIQVSARQVEGVLQLKLSSSHTELSRLLMQHQNEIRELLEKECEFSVEFQFDGQENGNMSQFFNDSPSSKGGSHFTRNSKSSGKNSSGTSEQVISKSVRKFGYNQMEWTA